MKTNRRDFLATSLGLVVLPAINQQKPIFNPEEFRNKIQPLFDHFTHLYATSTEKEKSKILRDFDLVIAEYNQKGVPNWGCLMGFYADKLQETFGGVR